MSLREKLNASPAIAAAAAAIGIVLAAIVLWWWYGGGIGSSEGKTYFYDLGSQERIVMPSGTLPPIDLPSGAGNGVEAAVFSCSDCGSDAKVLYLIRYTDEGKRLAAMQQAGQQDTPEGEPIGELLARNTEIREINGTNWVPANSPAATNIMRLAAQSCGDGVETIQCFPAE